MFNWFRRALGKTEENATVENQPASSVTEAPETPDPEATTKLPPDSPIAPPEPEATPEPEPKVDYLAWAKTAFQNIQARQAPSLDTPTAAPEAVNHPTENFPSPVIAPPPDNPPTPQDSATNIPEAPSQPEISVTTAPDSPPLPSPETPVGEITDLTVPATPTPTTEPDAIPLALDEGFLWSAEVLASQGRRPEDVDLEEITWLQKLRQGLGKTRRGLVNQLKAVVGRGPLGADAVEDIESLLLQADVGVAATDKIIQALQTKIRQDALPADQAIDYLKQILRDVLEEPFQNGYDPNFAPQKQRLNIWLMTGVNGVGKTTTIGKIAHVASTSGYPCLVAAADTFRAAAVEQVKIWAARSGVEVIANPGKNTDPAAVVFDGISAAQSRHCELLLIDTAGRLQNKQNLMEELKKIRRIVDKKAPDAHIESLLVLDATLGQNGLRQAQVFAEAAQLTGVVITKLDGTAKGGVALAVVQELGLPIRFIGAGEGIKDLRPFSSYEFVEALLSS
ncbi:signal recognition particle-docking protein FtsY [Thermosynechococcaceae cyanobacterium BACA0444]|uniref:Signal recognition particle receptor FtsY n=1 Tax=Pseudocalidococcus azoricus BACA0444 TaxID=2918990 RepID=A0AAE4FPN8_9CYAN|nr:signal recognition particle-docking protein FtsY [Pseudocalidococcus azoricus]MDS3859816.1 signal recognition particle-docking protein FtsY [Pseudocalidococcus azoricus BACA0444]